MSDFYTCVMGQPDITRTAAAHAVSGDNTLVAAPAAGYRLVVLYVSVQNESATATTGILKYGSTSVARRSLAQYGSFERDFGLYPLILPEATALVLNLGGANSHGVTVEYVTIPAAP